MSLVTMQVLTSPRESKFEVPRLVTSALQIDPTCQLGPPLQMGSSL